MKSCFTLRHALTRSVSGAALTAMLWAAPAIAQGTVGKSSSGLEDIVVTARKVAENLQDIPVAVTVQTGDALRQQSAVQVPDIARLTPGITFTQASSNGSASNITIRGQVQTDVLATLDPSVGVYVDGFYWARAYGLNANLLDVQSAQVLRGPQGTLFGRNTTGGALLIQSNDPNYDGVSGMMSATYGRFNERNADAVLNLPIVADKAALRAGFTVNKRDGFIKNEISGRDLAERDSYTGRVKLRLDPTDNFQLIFSGEFYGMKNYDRPYELLYVAPTSPANIEAALEANPANAALLAVPGGVGQLVGIGSGLYSNYIANYTGTDRSRLNDGDPRVDVKTQTYVMTANLDTFWGALKFIGGYRTIKSFAPLDLDGSPYSIVKTTGKQDLQSYSGELQATGTAMDDKIDFAGGFFAFNETGRDESTSIALPALTRVSARGLLPQTYYIGDITNRSMGMYLQSTFHFTDALSATGGVRYSVEDKNIVSFNATRNADTDALLSCLIATAEPGTCRAQSKSGFDGISYTLGLNYQINPDVLVYIKTSKGFRSGGQNLRAAGSTTGGAFAPFGPEVAREHEAGVKAEMFGRRVRFNLAAFYNEVKDIQRTTLLVSANGSSTSTVVSNAGKARFYGGEAELTARLFEGLTLSGTAALSNAKYLEFADASGDRRDEEFQNVPEWTFSIAGDYEKSIGSSTVRAHLDYAWQDDTALYSYRTLQTGNALNDSITNAVAKALTRPAGGELNGRVGMSFADETIEIALFGRNILNRRVDVAGLLFGAPLFAAMGKRNDPATYGVTATFKFGGF